ncbi:hypothetical protein ONR57_21845 [Hoyosella sp. YIM 151337]|uniref:HAAS signaling domain-containing protein n=1 Tax=Hoyosella sp. YIM 151337 TaxID=2992742 RepID=UPI0022363FE0|nr:hypothetical protein [Hoyosella sp. YIM 151337]MCW4355953.1 hypothetical protein [Hoyosella sp. YIM 151337]
MASLSEQYIAAVTRRLPPASRREIAEELRATIADMVAARPGPNAEWETLNQLGDPAVLSAEYRGSPQHLIGAELYPDYVRMLKSLVLVAFPVIALLVALPRVVLGNGHPGEVIAAAGLWTFVAGVQLIFWMTLVFVVAERTGNRHRHFTMAWTPDSLSRTSMRTSRSDAAFSIIVLLLVLGFVPWQQFFAAVPVIDPALWRGWLPAIMAAIASLLLADIRRMQTGRWSRWTATVAVVGDLAVVGVLAWAATVSPLVNPEFLTAIGADPATFPQWILVAIIGVFVLGDVAAVVVGARAQRYDYRGGKPEKPGQPSAVQR